MKFSDVKISSCSRIVSSSAIWNFRFSQSFRSTHRSRLILVICGNNYCIVPNWGCKAKSWGCNCAPAPTATVNGAGLWSACRGYYKWKVLTTLTKNDVWRSRFDRTLMTCWNLWTTVFQDHLPAANYTDRHKAKVHFTSFPVASPQQVSNFPIASFPKIHYISFSHRLNLLLGLTAVLTSKRLTALTTTWPHYYCYPRDPTITVTCPCSPWTYATLKYIRSSSSSSSTSIIKSVTSP